MKAETWIKLALIALVIWGFTAGLNTIDLEKIGTVQTERIERIESVR